MLPTLISDNTIIEAAAYSLMSCLIVSTLLQMCLESHEYFVTPTIVSGNKPMLKSVLIPCRRICVFVSIFVVRRKASFLLCRKAYNKLPFFR